MKFCKARKHIPYQIFKHFWELIRGAKSVSGQFDPGQYWPENICFFQNFATNFRSSIDLSVLLQILRGQVLFWGETYAANCTGQIVLEQINHRLLQWQEFRRKGLGQNSHKYCYW